MTRVTVSHGTQDICLLVRASERAELRGGLRADNGQRERRARECPRVLRVPCLPARALLTRRGGGGGWGWGWEGHIHKVQYPPGFSARDNLGNSDYLDCNGGHPHTKSRALLARGTARARPADSPTGLPLPPPTRPLDGCQQSGRGGGGLLRLDRVGSWG